MESGPEQAQSNRQPSHSVRKRAAVHHPSRRDFKRDMQTHGLLQGATVLITFAARAAMFAADSGNLRRNLEVSTASKFTGSTTGAMALEIQACKWG
eukprot:1040448-Alexandrium_andersonii.AAC.1